MANIEKIILRKRGMIEFKLFVYRDQSKKLKTITSLKLER